jgi:hypothetical protein
MMHGQKNIKLPILSLYLALVIYYAIRMSPNLLSSVPCSVLSHFLLPVALRPNAGQGLLGFEVSRTHTTTHYSC